MQCTDWMCSWTAAAVTLLHMFGQCNWALWAAGGVWPCGVPYPLISYLKHEADSPAKVSTRSHTALSALAIPFFCLSTPCAEHLQPSNLQSATVLEGVAHIVPDPPDRPAEFPSFRFHRARTLSS